MTYKVSDPTHPPAHQSSVHTKNPVRVVRGFKNRSVYGPEEGSVRAVAGVWCCTLIINLI